MGDLVRSAMRAHPVRGKLELATPTWDLVVKGYPDAEHLAQNAAYRMRLRIPPGGLPPAARGADTGMDTLLEHS